MKVKLIHAHFLISIGDYSNERIGFTVELEEGETVETVVPQLREQAVKAVGAKGQELYDARWELQRQCNELQKKLDTARTNWEATAEFLRAQGIKTDTPSMPIFNNLLTAKVESESVTDAEVIEDCF